MKKDALIDPLPKLTLEDASRQLKTAGLRRTVTRTTILQLLSVVDAPVSHAEICELTASNGFDSSTIFRALTDLAMAGLVFRIDAGDRVWRFELRDGLVDGNFTRYQHSHAVCQQCGRMLCLRRLDLNLLDAHVEQWKIDDVILRGTCSDCLEDGKATN